MSRFLAVDFGSRRIGLALSDETKTIVRILPALEVRSEKQVLRALTDLIAQEEVEQIILGLPLAMKGTTTAQTEAVQRFGARLEKRFPQMPVKYWDERLTTQEAERKLREGGGKARRSEIDSMSALVILETFLRSLRK
jgi:putative Holliday junction resolvase